MGADVWERIEYHCSWNFVVLQSPHTCTFFNAPRNTAASLAILESFARHCSSLASLQVQQLLSYATNLSPAIPLLAASQSRVLEFQDSSLLDREKHCDSNLKFACNQPNWHIEDSGTQCSKIIDIALLVCSAWHFAHFRVPLPSLRQRHLRVVYLDAANQITQTFQA